MADVNKVQSKQVHQPATTPIKLPPEVLAIVNDRKMFDAMLERSGEARALDAEIRGYEKSGRLVTRDAVEDMLGRVGHDKKTKKPRPECAVVLAYHAHHKPRLFTQDAIGKAQEFIETVDKLEFKKLMADLEAFVDRL